MRSLGSDGETTAVREEEIGQGGKDQSYAAGGSLSSKRKDLKTLFQSLLPPAAADSSDPSYTKAPSDGAQDSHPYTSDLLDIDVSKGEIAHQPHPV